MTFSKTQNSKDSQRGNVLWFIMIAIIFMGLITMALTRSSSSVDQSGDREQMRIKTGQILRHAKGLEAAIETMKLRGVSENDISFENTITATDYTNANCTTMDCRLFEVDGGGMSYLTFSGANDGSEWIFTGANNVGTTADPVGTTAARSGNDLIMLLPNATNAFCIELNRQLSVGTPGDIPTDTGGIATTEFTGAYANALTLIDADPSPFELDGQYVGCFTDAAASPDVTYFYYVLLAR